MVFPSCPPPLHTRAGEGIRGPGRGMVQGEYQVRVTHAAAPRRCTPVPPGTAQKPLGPFPSLAGSQPGHQSLFPQPRLGVPHLPSGLAPNHGDSSPLTLINACGGTGQLQGCWKGALRCGFFSGGGEQQGAGSGVGEGGEAGRRGNLACRGASWDTLQECLPAPTAAGSLPQHPEDVEPCHCHQPTQGQHWRASVMLMA